MCLSRRRSMISVDDVCRSRRHDRTRWVVSPSDRAEFVVSSMCVPEEHVGVSTHLISIVLDERRRRPWNPLLITTERESSIDLSAVICRDMLRSLARLSIFLSFVHLLRTCIAILLNWPAWERERKNERILSLLPEQMRVERWSASTVNKHPPRPCSQCVVRWQSFFSLH